MRGLSRKESELERLLGAFSAGSGCLGTPQIKLKLEDASGPGFELAPLAAPLLPGTARSGGSIPAAPATAGPGDGIGEGLELLALGASGLLDWRRKREASPRA